MELLLREYAVVFDAGHDRQAVVEPLREQTHG